MYGRIGSCFRMVMILDEHQLTGRHHWPIVTDYNARRPEAELELQTWKAQADNKHHSYLHRRFVDLETYLYPTGC